MRWSSVLSIVVISILLVSAFASAYEYPALLVENDRIDAAIVVGEKGSAQDFQAAAHVLSDLLVRGQAQGVKSAGFVSTPYRYQVKNAYDFLEGGESLAGVRDRLTEKEFASLARGSVTNSRGTFGYEQHLLLGSGTKVRFSVASGVPDDKKEIPNAYLNFDETYAAYDYRVSFREAWEGEVDADNDYAVEDFEGNELTLLGSTYVVLKAEHPANGSLTLTLLSDSVSDMLSEGETKTYTLDGKDYEVTVEFISDEPEALITINGDSLGKLEKGEIERFEDIMVYVKEVLYNDRNGAVTIALGEGEMVLSDADITDGAYGSTEYAVGREDVEDTAVWIEGLDDGLVEDGIVRITALGVKWTPDERHYVAGGQKLSDVLEDKNTIFGQSFDISYEGTKSFAYEGPLATSVLEALQLKPSGDDRYMLSFTNKLEQALEIPLFYDDGGSFARFGTEDETLHVLENVSIALDDYFLVTSDGYLNVTAARGHTRLLQYAGQDADSNLLRIEDIASGEVYEVRYADGATQAYLRLPDDEYLVKLSDAADDGAITVDLNDDGTIDTGDKPVLVTVHGLNIELVTSGTGAYKQVVFYSSRKEEPLTGQSFNLALYSSIGASIQAAYNLSANPVSTTNAVTEFHDAVRITVVDDDGEIDISNVDRCLDYGTPWQIEAAVPNASYKAAVRDAFFGSVCFPSSSTGALTFLLDAEDGSDDRMGTTGYGQKAVWKDDSNGPDTVQYFSSKVQSEHVVVFHATSTAPAEASGAVARPLKTAVETYVDTEARGLDVDAIVVGGPCANRLAADFLGTQGGCAAGYEAGRGRITRIDDGGRDVVIISGMTSEDTFLAAKAFLAGRIEGDDVMVSGSEDAPIIEPYVASAVPEGAQAAAEPAAPVAPVAPAAPAEPVADFSCGAANDVSGSYDLRISKLGITRELVSSPRVEMDGKRGTIVYDASTRFEAQLGVDWMQYVAHIHQGTCDGPEIAAFTFKWEDGDEDKEQSFSVPVEGCYCLKVSDADVTIDDADIEMTSGGGVFTLPFSTESPEESLLTGNVVAWDLFPSRPKNDMDIWD